MEYVRELPKEAYDFWPEGEDVFTGEGKKLTRFIFYRTCFSGFELQELNSLKKSMASSKSNLPDEELLRLLISCSFDRKATLKLISELDGKDSAVPHFQSCPYSKDLLEEGSIYMHGHDLNFRPIIVINIARMHLKTHTIQDYTALLRYVLDHVLTTFFLPGQIENWVVITDLGHLSMGKLPLKDMRSIVKTLQNVYRCRMFANYIVNAPSSINLVWTMLKRFINKNTVKKVKIHKNVPEELNKMCSCEQLEEQYGGNAPTARVFWPPHIPQTCKKTQAESKLVVQCLGRSESLVHVKECSPENKQRIDPEELDMQTREMDDDDSQKKTRKREHRRKKGHAQCFEDLEEPELNHAETSHRYSRSRRENYKMYCVEEQVQEYIREQEYLEYELSQKKKESSKKKKESREKKKNKYYLECFQKDLDKKHRSKRDLTESYLYKKESSRRDSPDKYAIDRKSPEKHSIDRKSPEKYMVDKKSPEKYMVDKKPAEKHMIDKNSAEKHTSKRDLARRRSAKEDLAVHEIAYEYPASKDDRKKEKFAVETREDRRKRRNASEEIPPKMIEAEKKKSKRSRTKEFSFEKRIPQSKEIRQRKSSERDEEVEIRPRKMSESKKSASNESFIKYVKRAQSRHLVFKEDEDSFDFVTMLTDEPIYKPLVFQQTSSCCWFWRRRVNI